MKKVLLLLSVSLFILLSACSTSRVYQTDQTKLSKFYKTHPPVTQQHVHYGNVLDQYTLYTSNFSSNNNQTTGYVLDSFIYPCQYELYQKTSNDLNVNIHLSHKFHDYKNYKGSKRWVNKEKAQFYQPCYFHITHGHDQQIVHTNDSLLTYPCEYTKLQTKHTVYQQVGGSEYNSRNIKRWKSKIKKEFNKPCVLVKKSRHHQNRPIKTTRKHKAPKTVINILLKGGNVMTVVQNGEPHFYKGQSVKVIGTGKSVQIVVDDKNHHQYY